MLNERRKSDASVAIMDMSRAQVWSRHWASGVMHSCVQGGKAALGPGFANFWRAQWQSLSSEARVLELGCGNGVLPWSALDWRESFDLSYDAVDWAQIDPPWLRELPAHLSKRLRFHGGQRMESLPFADQQFDAVFSQFALEYSELPRSVAEIRRVARSGAAVALVCHHQLGLPVRLARVEWEHIRQLLEPEGGLLQCAVRVAPWFAQAQTVQGRASLAHNPTARHDREAFNRAQDQLTETLISSICPDVIHECRAQVAQCLQWSASGQVERAQAALDALEVALNAASVRLQELLTSALDDAGVGRLQRMLGLDVSVRPTELRDEGELMGWSLAGRLGGESRD